MKKRILIADDDVGVRDSLRKLLEAAGYEVVCATNGEEAECRVGSENIDLLLLDLDLPKENGWNVFGMVNAQDPLLPIILITGLKNQAEEDIVPGVAAFLEKPIEVPVLLKVIEDTFAETAESRFRRMRDPVHPRKLLQPL